jgi:hypothetical protein
VKAITEFAVTIAVLTLAGCGQGTLDRKAVRAKAERVRSFAVEGRIAADQLVRGRLKESFAQVHAADLAQLASTAEKDLEPSLAAARLHGTVERLQTVAAAVSVQLRVVETEPREHELLRDARERLDELAGEAHRIASRL